MRHVDRKISNIEYVRKQKEYDGDYIYNKVMAFLRGRGDILIWKGMFSLHKDEIWLHACVEETMTLIFFHLFCLSNGLDKVIVSLCWMPMLGGKTDHEKILKIMVKTRRFSLPMLSTKGSNHWIMEILMGISHHISTVSLPRNKTLFGGGLSKKDHVSMTSRTGTAKFCFFSWGKKSGTLERVGVLPLGIPINSQPGLQCLLPTHRLIDVDCGEMWM